MKHSSFDETISALDVETSALGSATSAIARSYWRYRRGISSDIGDCGVGVTPQVCNRVTNQGDMSTFSKPGISNNYNYYCNIICPNYNAQPESVDPCFVDR